MMVEINFLDQKKRKSLLYAALGTLFILLLIAGIILSVQKANQEQMAVIIEKQLQENNPKLEVLKHEKALQDDRLTLENHILSVGALTFPALSLLDRMVFLLPEQAYYANFSYDRRTGVEIEIQIENIDQAAAYASSLNKENYISNADLVSINKTEESETNTNSYIAAFSVQIDEQIWKEEHTDEN